MALPTNLGTARGAKLRPLDRVAEGMGIGSHLLEPYGAAVAKIKLDAIEEFFDRPKAKYVVVSAITPVPGGVEPVTDVWLLRNAAFAARLAAGHRHARPPEGGPATVSEATHAGHGVT